MPQETPYQSGHVDVRMRGFSRRSTVDEALLWLDGQISPLEHQSLSLTLAAGRVLAEDVVSQVDVPGFQRAMMDGYAVMASDTAGATAYNRLPLEVVGQALPGQGSPETIGRGQAIRIMTGAPLVAGADAVLPAEQSEIEEQRVWIQGEVSPGKNVGLVGEDIAVGTKVLAAGRRLRPQDIGVLSSIGIDSISVIRQPRVHIVVTGDEILPGGSMPSGYCIADANGPMLQALAERDGATVTNSGIIPDDPVALLNALDEDVEVVLVSGGSSVGQEDHAPMLLARNGQLAVHGIAMRPSSPAGMGCLGNRLVFLLPGNPVSCLCAYDFFAGRAIRALGGRRKQWPYRRKRLAIRRKLVSVIGRVDYARVRVENEGVEPLSISGASILSSTTRADGFVIVPADSEGYPSEAEVDVYLYDLENAETEGL